jgi:hypothetical protein
LEKSPESHGSNLSRRREESGSIRDNFLSSTYEEVDALESHPYCYAAKPLNARPARYLATEKPTPDTVFRFHAESARYQRFNIKKHYVHCCLKSRAKWIIEEGKLLLPSLSQLKRSH